MAIWWDYSEETRQQRQELYEKIRTGTVSEESAKAAEEAEKAAEKASSKSQASKSFLDQAKDFFSKTKDSSKEVIKDVKKSGNTLKYLGKTIKFVYYDTPKAVLRGGYKGFKAYRKWINKKYWEPRRELIEKMGETMDRSQVGKMSFSEFKDWAVEQASKGEYGYLKQQGSIVKGSAMKTFWTRSAGVTGVLRESGKAFFHGASMGMVVHPLYATKMFFSPSVILPNEAKEFNAITKGLLKLTGANFETGFEMTAGRRFIAGTTGLLFGKSAGMSLLNAAFIGLRIKGELDSDKYELSTSMVARNVASMAVGFGAFEAANALIGYALAGAGVGGPIGAAIGLIGGSLVAMAAETQAFHDWELRDELRSHLGKKYNMLRQRGFNMGIVDTRMAATMRQQSLQAIQKSYMSARQFVLGNEATLLERSL